MDYGFRIKLDNGDYLYFGQGDYEYVFDKDGDVTALRKVIVNKMTGKIMNFVGYLPCLPILSFFGSKCSVIHNNRYLNGNFYTYRSPCIITFLKRLKFKALNPIPLEWMPTWHPLPFPLYLRHGFRSESEDVVVIFYHMTQDVAQSKQG